MRTLLSLLIIFAGLSFIQPSHGKDSFPELDKTKLSVPAKGKITSKAGCRSNIMTGGKETFHGINIAAAHGAPIYATAAGKVTGTKPNVQAYGNLTRIKHGGEWSSYYAHQSEFLVKEGDVVKSGQIIGRIGNTGRATGPVLTFLVINGEDFINPMALLYPEKNYSPSIEVCSE